MQLEQIKCKLCYQYEKVQVGSELAAASVCHDCEDFFLLEADYQVAEANGIGRINAYKRVQTYGWTKQKAITQPLNYVTKGDPEVAKWKKVALAKGISQATFYRRIQRGDTPEVAANKPHFEDLRKERPKKEKPKKPKAAKRQGEKWRKTDRRVAARKAAAQ